VIAQRPPVGAQYRDRLVGEPGCGQRQHDGRDFVESQLSLPATRQRAPSQRSAFVEAASGRQEEAQVAFVGRQRRRNAGDLFDRRVRRVGGGNHRFQVA